MSTFVTIQCDRCYAKLGHGESVKEARREAKIYGLQRLRDLDLCSPCLDEDDAQWGDER